MQTKTLTLGHSPDPDDAFMFYALAKGLIPSPGFQFEHILQDAGLRSFTYVSAMGLAMELCQ